MAVSFQIETKRIEVGKGGFFDVRGVSADDFTYITGHFLDDLKAVAVDFSLAKFNANERSEMILSLAKSFPSLVAEIISRCADATEEERDTLFMRLPFAVTIKAIKAITDLTVEDGGVELGNLMAALANQLDAAGVNTGPLMKSLSAIISVAGKTSPIS